jgi:predicted aldo/keto reductase-like oxidoreductase
MERMTLGRTGLEAYRLGLGGIPIQRVSEPEAVETVCHAIQRGVDFIDTSRAYTTSERRIGLALKQTDNGLILASKSQGKTADKARADLEMSLKEFQRDYIHLYQCHFVSTEADYQTVISRGGALEALQGAKEEGLIGHIGITSHSLDVLGRAIDDGLFETIMVCLSFLEPDARNEVIPKAIAKNIGVIAMKPFSGGVIENARLALKYALAVPGVLVIPGAEHPQLFDEDWAVFQDPDPLTEAEKREIAAIQMVLGLRSMVKRMGVGSPLFGEAVVKARNCSECGECLTRCPYGLPIPDLIRENLRWFDETVGVSGRSK